MKVSRRRFIAGTAGAMAGTALWLEPARSFAQQADEQGRMYVFVIDLDRCDGCRKCTEACQTEMYVPPAWGGELQYDGRQPWIQVFDMGGGVYMPVPCQNCQNAPCAKVCPVGATYYSEDHIVLIDQNRCIGCRYCLAACPYQRRFFNWFDPPMTEQEKKIPYSPDYNIPHRKGVAEKCIWCRHRTKMGMVPACVDACRKAGMSALWFGDASQDTVSDGEQTVSLSQMLKGRGAYHLKDELGTLPSVIYLPPKGGVN